MRVPSIMYFDEKNDDTTNPWWKDLVPDVSGMEKRRYGAVDDHSPF